MIDFDFYTSKYLGASIPEIEFESVMTRAKAQLARLTRVYTVTAPDENAENMALCAIADALYYYDTVEAEGVAVSRSIGSVSTSMAQGTLPDTSPKAIAAEVLRCAKLYLNVERWYGLC